MLLVVVSCGSPSAMGGNDGGSDGMATALDVSADDDTTREAADAPKADASTSDRSPDAFVDSSAGPTDGASTDGAAEAGYALCDGTIDPALKMCVSDADCTFAAHSVDCCGGILYVGISKTSATTFAQCEAAWDGHFSACACTSDAKSTEDGQCLGMSCPRSDASIAADAGEPQVHCVKGTGESRSCQTSLR